MIWIWNNDILNTTGSKYRKYGKKKRLLIKELTYEDSGVYECAFASNITEKGRTELWSELAIMALYSYAKVN